MSKSHLIHILAFIEGLNLMGFELVTSRVMSVAYGSTIKVWAILLAFTLLFLAIGYYLGGKLSLTISNSMSKLYLLLLATALFLYFFMPVSYSLIQSFTDSGTFLSMAFFTTLILCLPIVTFGIISPVLISLEFKDHGIDPGTTSGRIYGVSTLGGVVSTFLFGLYLIPNTGLHKSTLLLSMFVLLTMGVFFVYQKLVKS